MKDNTSVNLNLNYHDIGIYRDQISKELQASGFSLQKEYESLLSGNLPLLDLYCGARLLILNSGHGELSELINHYESSVNILNADISGEMIKQMDARNPVTTQVRIQSYAQLPFEDEQFDRIITLFLFGEQLADLPSHAKEIARISIPDSTWVLIYPCSKKRSRFRQILSGYNTSLTTNEEVKTLLIDSGWKSIKCLKLMPVSVQGLIKSVSEQITQPEQKIHASAEQYDLYLFACKK
jgi:ubiquinone/menaquinone biosynthesis C-methylase UbiE